MAGIANHKRPRLRRLHRAGRTDKEIAAAFAVDVSLIVTTRRLLGLRPNPAPAPDRRGRNRPIPRAEVARLAKLRWSDKRIAEFLKFARQSVAKVRKEMGFAPGGGTLPAPARLAAPGMTDAEIRAKFGVQEAG